ncbi:DNA polymerase I [Candidatus Omnitrophota bacterium]
MSKKNKNIYLIDGTSLCYRAFYAIQDLSTSKGIPTNAVYGFVNMMKKLIREYEPDMMTVVFDLEGPTTRHEKYEDYKAHREPTPDDLIYQIPKIKELVKAYNIPICELQGYEADDIIATLAEKAKKKGLDVTIVTSDKDALQLIDENIKVLSPHPSGDKLYSDEEVREKYGVGPESMVEFMALTGDSSDNIPGVKGVGKVTASKLINQYGSVKDVYKNLKEITSKSVRGKLEEGKEMAELSRELVELDKKVPVKLDFDKTKMGDPDRNRLAKLYTELEFGKFLKEIQPKEAITGEYSFGNTEKAVDGILKEISDKKKVAFNVAVGSEGKEVVGIAFSCKEGEAQFIPLSGEKGRPKGTWDLLKHMLEEKGIKKIGYDIKKDLLVLRDHGIEVKGVEFDVMIADYLIDPSRPKFDLSGIALRHLEYNLAEEGGSVDWDEKGQATMDLSAKDEGFEKWCERSDIILRLYGTLEPELEKKHLDALFNDVEMPLINVLADMEHEGVGIDIGYLKKRSADLEKKLKEVSARIYELAGEEFNINSPKQLQVILYEKLELPAMKKTKTGLSTDESVLRKLTKFHELPGDLLEYREINKLKTGYYDSILEIVDKKTKKLHAHFNQAVTATGRLSSSEPNLQNIPIKTELGKEIRRAFLPGGKGKLLLAVDYSQVELRILAHLSRDKSLIDAFSKKQDIHRFTASLIFDCPIKEVTGAMRSVAKTVNFGITYGMSSFGLAKDLGIRFDEAQKFIDSYFNRYSGIQKFIDKTIDDVGEKGYVTTLLNRRRYIPEINSRNERLRGFAERAAVNTPVQGSAADLIKLAMIECHKAFKGTGVKMLIQVHDELVFEVSEKKLKATAKKIKELMEGVIKLKVPLVVDVEAGPNWFDMEEIKL